PYLGLGACNRAPPAATFPPAVSLHVHMRSASGLAAASAAPWAARAATRLAVRGRPSAPRARAGGPAGDAIRAPLFTRRRVGAVGRRRFLAPRGPGAGRRP